LEYIWPSVLFDLGLGPDLVNRYLYHQEPTTEDTMDVETEIDILDQELLRSDDEVSDNENLEDFKSNTAD